MNRKSTIQKILREGLNLQYKQTEQKRVYVVVYQDAGNNLAYSVEAVIEKEEDFPLWLRMHNYQRYQEGEILEDADDFNVLAFDMYTYISPVPDIPENYINGEYVDEN